MIKNRRVTAVIVLMMILLSPINQPLYLFAQKEDVASGNEWIQSINLFTEIEAVEEHTNDPVAFKDEIVTKDYILTDHYSEKYQVQLNHDVIHEYENLQVGQLITMDLSNSEALLLEIEGITQDINDVTSLRGSVVGRDYEYFYITIEDHKFTMVLDDLDNEAKYRVVFDKDSKEHYLYAIPFDHIVVPENLAPMVPEMDVEFSQDEVNDDFHNTRLQYNPYEVATIDVMIVYTPEAKWWAENYDGGINSVIAQSMNKAQQTLDNSQVQINMELVHSEELNYRESYYGSEQDLKNITERNGIIDEVHEMRDEYGADLVAMFTYVNDTGGIGWSLQGEDQFAYFDRYAFSITRVQQASSSYTHIHEMGHNMGAGHHRDQSVQAGPQLYNYSSGWRWDDPSGNKLTSVMSYTPGMFYPDGINGITVPYFSNPEVTFNGVATGDRYLADNARSLRETKHLIAGFRDRPEEETYKVTFNVTPEEAVYEVVVNNDQYYALNKLVPGNYDFTVTADGYQSYEGTFSVTDQDVVVDVTLTKTEKIEPVIEFIMARPTEIGNTLSSAELTGKFVDPGNNEILEGRLEWKDTEQIITKTSEQFHWVFTPTSAIYEVVEGTVEVLGISELLSINILETPTKTQYLAEEAIDLQGLRVEASYNDGTSKVIPHDELIIQGFDSSITVDDQEVIVSYKGMSDRFYVTIREIEPAKRTSGSNRYLTAYEIAKENNPNPDTVILVRGDDANGIPQVVDGLTASGLAGAKDAQILLTQPNRLTTATKDALLSLQPKKVIIVGGEGAVGTEVVKALQGLATDGLELEIQRVSGSNRFATAAEVALEIAVARDNTAIIVNGTSEVDSLVAGPLAHKGYPILMVNNGRGVIPEETINAIKTLGIENLLIIGGYGVVSQDMENQLNAIEGVNVQSRYGGASRVETSLLLGQHEAFESARRFSMVNGLSYVDAVAASTLKDPVIYIIPRQGITEGLGTFIKGKEGFRAIGGMSVISEEIFNGVTDLLINNN